MTKEMFDGARERGKTGKIGQLNPTGRYGVAQGTYFVLASCKPCFHELTTRRRNRADGAILSIR